MSDKVFRKEGRNGGQTDHEPKGHRSRACDTADCRGAFELEAGSELPGVRASAGGQSLSSISTKGRPWAVAWPARQAFESSVVGGGDGACAGDFARAAVPGIWADLCQRAIAQAPQDRDVDAGAAPGDDPGRIVESAQARQAASRMAAAPGLRGDAHAIGRIGSRLVRGAGSEVRAALVH